jgi:hypothetical protein
MKRCKAGYYYCYTDKKCKSIPKGFKVVGPAGYLRKENGHSVDDESETETKKNGNGNGENGGDGGAVSEGWSEKYKRSIDCKNPKGFSQKAHCKGRLKEESNPRIPRKKGQPANSKKHSDLYTDENPVGTIHGLGFKDIETAKASVAKIKKSDRSHAHKIQAAVAMEQRAREMGKTSEAAIYRKFINSMKKKTEKMNEAKEKGDHEVSMAKTQVNQKVY